MLRRSDEHELREYNEMARAQHVKSMLLLGSFLVFMLFFGVAVTGFGFLPRSQTSGVPGRNLTLTTLLAEAGAPADALMLMAALVLVGVLGYGASRLTFDAFARVMSVVGLLAMVALTFGLYLHPEVLERVLNWVRGLGLLGHAIMTLSFVVVSLPLTVGCVVLAMCCGFIYGFWVGSLTACLGLLIGGVVSFWGLSKLLKQPVMRYVRGKPKLFAIMRALRDNQWYVSLVLRPSPVPLGLQNGLLAITVPFHVFLATLPAAFPEQCLFVYFGAEANELMEVIQGKVQMGPAKMAFLIFDAVMGILVLVACVVFGHRIINRAVPEGEDINLGSDHDLD